MGGKRDKRGVSRKKEALKEGENEVKKMGKNVRKEGRKEEAGGVKKVKKESQ